MRAISTVGPHAVWAGIAMAFFGFQALLAGWLMLGAAFLPRVLGVLSLLGGVCFVTHLWPPLGYRVGDIGLLVGLVGVVFQTFWFLVFGVNETRWYEQASATRGV